MVKGKSDRFSRILTTTKRKSVPSFMNPIRNPISLVTVAVVENCLRNIPKEISKPLLDVPSSHSAEIPIPYLKVQIS